MTSNNNHQFPINRSVSINFQRTSSSLSSLESNPAPSSRSTMGAISRGFLVTVSLFSSLLLLFGVLFGAVLGQQSGQLSSSTTATSSSSIKNTENDTFINSFSNSIDIDTANNNNYAASVSLLTSTTTNNNNNSKSHKDKYSDKYSSGSTHKSDNFGYGDFYKSSSDYQQPVSHLYSPYLMPISNYYTGSSSTSVSSISSPYRYTHYNSQADSSKSSSSLKDKLLKSSSSNQKSSSSSGNVTGQEESVQQKLNRQLQMALMYQHLLALQQYRALYGSGIGDDFYSSPYSAYPGTVAALYNYYGRQNGDPTALGIESSGSSLSPSTVSTSGTSASTTAAGSTAADPDKDSAAAALAEAAQLQTLASMLQYRQQLAKIYGNVYGSGGTTGGGGLYSSSNMYGRGLSMGISPSSIYGQSLGGTGGFYRSLLSSMGGAGSPSGTGSLSSASFGYPSSLFGGAGAGSSGHGAGSFLGSSSLFGSAMPTGGGGMFSGLSSLTGGAGLGMLNTLGMIFG